MKAGTCTGSPTCKEFAHEKQVDALALNMSMLMEAGRCISSLIYEGFPHGKHVCCATLSYDNPEAQQFKLS